MKKRGTQKPVVTQKISIKSMNQKIRRVGERFGIDSLPYKNLIADIENDFRGMTHTTAKGIIQVSQSKTFTPNDYQKRAINKVAARKGVKEITETAKERLKQQGIKKPTREQIIEDVTKYTQRQTHIDETLDLIYKHEIANDLPIDIYNKYNTLHRSSGQGITNSDLDFIIDNIKAFDEIREDVEEINADIRETILSEGGILPADYSTELYGITSGQYDMNTIKTIYDKMQRYRDAVVVSNDPLQVEYV